MNAGVMGSRLRNRQLALNYIRQTGGCSRSDLMRELGLSRSGVNHLVSALIEEGIIEPQQEAQDSRGKRGRPSTFLNYRGSGGLVAGVDLGHGHVTVALATLSGEIRAEASESCDVDHDPEGAAQLARRLYDKLFAEVGASRVHHVVVGVPGPINERTGSLHAPTVLAGWINVRPLDLLERHFNVPVSLAHDATLGAYGEQLRGAGRGLQHVLYVKVSGGVGAAMIVNGQRFVGASGLAGEIGHTTIQGTSELCRCGNRGCLESIVSADTIRRQLGLSAGRDYDADTFDFREIKDVAGVRILSEAGWSLGRHLSDLCNCINPQVVVLGGSLGAHSDTFLRGVEQSISRFAQPGVVEDLEIVHSALGERSEIVGAVMLAVERAIPAISHE